MRTTRGTWNALVRAWLAHDISAIVSDRQETLYEVSFILPFLWLLILLVGIELYMGLRTGL